MTAANVKDEKNQTLKDGRQKPRPGIEEQSKLIIAAAVPLFLAQGVRNVAITQICESANVSRSTFYRCFEDIKSLLEYVYKDAVFQPVEEYMLANLDKALSQESLRRILDEMLETIFARGQYAELLFRESHDPNSSAFEIVDTAFDNIVQALIQYLPIFSNNKTDKVYLKSLLFSYQWIAHDTIRKSHNKNGLSTADKKAAKEAAWKLLENALQKT